MKNVKVNLAYNFTYQILIMILPLATAPYLSRVIGVEGLGIYSYTYSIAYYFIIFAMMGLNNYGNRSIAKIRDDKEKLNAEFWEIYAMQVFNSLIVLCGYLIYMELFGNNNIFIIIQSLLVISTLFDINWFFFGLEEFKLPVIRNCIIKTVTVIMIFIFVKRKEDLSIYIFIMALGILISQLSLWPLLLKRIKFIKPKWANIRKHFLQNSILFIPVIAVSLYQVMDKILLGYLSNMTQVGLYDNSYKIIIIPMSAITALGTVMLPRSANLVALGKKEDNKNLIEKSMIFIMIFGAAFMFGISGISRVFAPVYFGQEFKDCDLLITMLSSTIPLVCWANIIRTQYLIPNNKDKIYVMSVLFGAAVNLILNLILDPVLGALGAATGTIAAEAFVCISQTIMVRKELDIRKYFYNGLPFIFLGLAMYFIVRCLEIGNIISARLLIVQILTGTVSYITLILLYQRFCKNTLTKTLIRSILQVFIKRRRIKHNI